MEAGVFHFILYGNLTTFVRFITAVRCICEIRLMFKRSGENAHLVKDP